MTPSWKIHRIALKEFFCEVTIGGILAFFIHIVYWFFTK